jgi:hypothetical protein
MIVARVVHSVSLKQRQELRASVCALVRSLLRVTRLVVKSVNSVLRPENRVLTEPLRVIALWVMTVSRVMRTSLVVRESSHVSVSVIFHSVLTSARHVQRHLT